MRTADRNPLIILSSLATIPAMARQAHPPRRNRLRFERALISNGALRIAGIDEAGRGPLAGPVMAAAVMLPLAWLRDGLPENLHGLNDSKQLSAAERELFFTQLTTDPEVKWQTAFLDAPAIDAVNILHATHQAMQRAAQALTPPPDHILVDGLPVPSLSFPHTAIVKGDSLSYSIAAASVIAKVARDRLMLEFETLYPGYGFGQHKGYGTPEHLAAIQRLGPCPIHRRSFAPMRPRQSELFPHVTLGSTPAVP